MRIHCPNCDAQYEVPDEVIPFEGRDVQCSNCGRTWFHPHPDNPEAADDVDDPESDRSGPGAHPDAEPEPDMQADTAHADVAPAEEDYPEDDPEVEPDDGPSDGSVDEQGDDADDDYDDVDDDALGPPSDLPQRKPLNEDVEAILREEAEKEHSARAAEALEIQQDLGLDESEDQSERRARESRERMARLKGEVPTAEDANPPADMQAATPEAEAAAAAAALGSRRELLPDIEEINSTLRSTGDREVAGNDPSPEASIRGHKRRGFKRGFATTMLLFAVALLVYIFHQDIARAVPQADPMLSAYVTWVDNLRIWLDVQTRGILDWLNTQAAQS